MSKRVLQILGLAFLMVGLVAARAGAQATENYNVDVASPATTAADTSGGIRIESPAGTGVTTSKIGIRPPAGFPFPMPPLDPRAVWKDQWLCRSAGPAEVTGFRVQCGNASFLDFHIADCCVPGDHWQLKGKIWDANPNTAVTTSPGPAPAYSVPGRVYRYNGTPFTKAIDAYVECSYLNGVNLFLADSFVVFSSDGACVVTPDPVVRRIDRTP